MPSRIAGDRAAAEPPHRDQQCRGIDTARLFTP
jgi:hypothetical protein